MLKPLVGKILGAVGLLLLLTSPFTWFLTAGAGALALGKAALGVLLIGAFFATNYGQLGQFASRRSTFFLLSSALTAVGLLASLGALNYVVAKKSRPIDLTSEQLFSLAPQTTQLLEALAEPVAVTAFLRADHPHYDAVEALLSRYHRQAPERFTYGFKDPRRHPDLAARYQIKEGETPLLVSRGEGATATHSRLDVLSEQELTNALLRLGAASQQKVYFLTGHGEWPLEAVVDAQGERGGLSQLAGHLRQEGYVPEGLGLAGREEVPRDAGLLVVAGARSPLAESEVEALRRYLAEGGRLLFFAEAAAEAGLDGLTAEYGIEVDPGVIADDRFASGSPYVVLSVFYGAHEMTTLLHQLQLNIELPTARGLTVLRGLPEGRHVETVLTTSPFGWLETTPDGSPRRSDGEKTGQIPLVAAATSDVEATPGRRFEQARLVVFGDSELLVDANWGHEGNRNLVLNALAWASNQVEKITLRPRDRELSGIELTPGTLARVRFVATDLVPISLLGLGLAIWLTRRSK